MKEPPIPETENQRVAALQRYDILDSESEQVFDELTELASKICDAPIGLISLIDSGRQWFKANVGLDGATETPREQAFCAHAINEDETFIVPDATQDDRFSDNPLVTGSPDIRFYAGQQLTTSDGHNIGTLCVIDKKPRDLDDFQKEALRILGAQVMSQIELRRNLKEMSIINRRALALETILRRYTSKSIWERADISVTLGEVDLEDEKLDSAVMFIDVVSFTSFAEGNDADEVIGVLNIYFDPIVEITVNHGGDVDKFVGDQVFCVFPDADQAVKAALEIRRRVRNLNDRRKAFGEHCFEVRTGTNYGPVIRGSVGAEMRRDNTLIGDTVNTAARLEKACEPGNVLIADNLYRACKNPPPLARTLRFQVRGKEEIIKAHYPQ